LVIPALRRLRQRDTNSRLAWSYPVRLRKRERRKEGRKEGRTDSDLPEKNKIKTNID
jgi:hypothetical protein